MSIPFYRYLEVGLYAILNLLPFLLIAMYPFRHRLRFSYGVTWTLIGGLIVIQQCLGILAAFSPVGSEIMSLMSTVIYAGFFVLAIKDNIGRLAFVLLVFSNLGNLVTVCAKFLEGLIFGDLALEAYRWSMNVCMLIMHSIITVPVASYVRKHFTSSVPIRTGTWNYLWAVPGTFYAIWFYHLYFTGRGGLEVALDIHHTSFLVIINLGAFVVYHISIRLLLEQKKSHDLAKNNYLLTLQTLQYENLQQRINEARRAKHDVRHHVHLLQEYLRSGKLQELEAYLDKYSVSLPDTQSLVYCQHYETNALLGYYTQQAREKGIQTDVRVLFPETLRLPETTVSVVLGNLMENAIQASSEITIGEKKISVQGRVSGGFVFLEVANHYNGTLKKTKDGEYLSTKHKGQGLGLDSVSQLVHYHNGVIEVDTKDQMFRVSVMLQEQHGTDTTSHSE